MSNRVHVLINGEPFGPYPEVEFRQHIQDRKILKSDLAWREGWLRFSFWAMNGGLFAMCVLSLLPVGLMQTWASVDRGYWYARSSEFLGSPLMQNLRWMRVPGDTVFAIGAVALVIFVGTIRAGSATTGATQGTAPSPAAK